MTKKVKDTFIGCTLRQLPDADLVSAAALAVHHNPANKPSQIDLHRFASVMKLQTSELHPDHLALLTAKYWGAAGVKLTVSFVETTPSDLQQRILSHMNAWGQWCNAVFTLVPRQGQVRISRGPGGYWSYLGTDVLSIPQSEPTMNLEAFSMSTPESEFVRVVRHETGHTLGFPHEHLRRELVSLIDVQKAIFYFGRTQGWSADEVRQQVLTPIPDSEIKSNAADQLSVMCYSLPGSITINGKPIIGGTDIDVSDQAFSALMYPKVITPPPPPPPPPPVNPPVSSKTVITLQLEGKVATVLSVQ